MNKPNYSGLIINPFEKITFLAELAPPDSRAFIIASSEKDRENVYAETCANGENMVSCREASAVSVPAKASQRLLSGSVMENVTVRGVPRYA
jgi:hypothetical protein